MKELIPKSWLPHLEAEFDKDYFKVLEAFLDEEYSTKKIFPSRKKIFNALELTPFEDVKVVIIGQDPYHGEGQAHGLAFSVEEGVKIPPSLRNMYKEIQDDLGIEPPQSGNLELWARQGVLLLNAVLTVEESLAASHQKKGWEEFTDAIVKSINDKREGVIFLLWGNYAKKKANSVDRSKHYILDCGHPSPLSVRFFRGCKHFSKTNELLKGMNKSPVSWTLY